MSNYVWSAKNRCFFPTEDINVYEEAGWDIADQVDVDDDIFHEFTSQPPSGKILGVGPDNMPIWVNLPPRPNDELLHDELQKISDQYKLDINELNQAYLAAIVSDGPGEVAKQAAVRSAIDERKAQYVADKAAAREKYPV